MHRFTEDSVSFSFSMWCRYLNLSSLRVLQGLQHRQSSSEAQPHGRYWGFLGFLGFQQLTSTGARSGLPLLATRVLDVAPTFYACVCFRVFRCFAWAAFERLFGFRLYSYASNLCGVSVLAYCFLFNFAVSSVCFFYCCVEARDQG